MHINHHQVSKQVLIHLLKNVMVGNNKSIYHQNDIILNLDYRYEMEIFYAQLGVLSVRH